MEKGTVVVVNLQNPREKLIGALQEISNAGILLRGVDVNSFQDWIGELSRSKPGSSIAPSTVFFPMHRVVNFYVDEDMGDIPSFASQCLNRTGKPLEGFLT